jgi:hypothetical protein
MRGFFLHIGRQEGRVHIEYGPRAKARKRLAHSDTELFPALFVLHVGKRSGYYAQNHKYRSVNLPPICAMLLFLRKYCDS